MLKGLFRIAADLPLVFASTHFDFKSADTQVLQAECVLKNIENSDVPALVAGDFNCDSDSPALRILADSCAVLSGKAPTFPAKNPTERLDHIFGYPMADFRLVRTSEGPSGPDTASDHLPVFSVITLVRP